MEVKALNERPQLETGLDVFLKAYQDLQYDRPMGMALGPIPWFSIVRWAELHYLNDPDDIAVLVHHVREMERAVMEFDEKKSEKKGRK